MLMSPPAPPCPPAPPTIAPPDPPPPVEEPPEPPFDEVDCCVAAEQAARVTSDRMKPRRGAGRMETSESVHGLEGWHPRAKKGE